ncbi:MAG: hypothetical protein WCK31_03850 [bacterium]
MLNPQERNMGYYFDTSLDISPRFDNLTTSENPITLAKVSEGAKSLLVRLMSLGSLSFRSIGGRDNFLVSAEPDITREDVGYLFENGINPTDGEQILRVTAPLLLAYSLWNRVLKVGRIDRLTSDRSLYNNDIRSVSLVRQEGSSRITLNWYPKEDDPILIAPYKPQNG